MKRILFTIFSASFCSPLSAAVIDLNNNGVNDIWEQKYHATSLVSDEAGKSADTDADGVSNLNESLAGTDPRDPQSHNRVKRLTRANQTITLDAITQKGKSYQLSLSTTLAGNSWSDYGAPIKAVGDTLSTDILNQTSERVFYRFTAIDTDTDQDGVNDWDELQLEGFNPNQNDSFTSGTTNNDLAAANALVAALLNNEISITSTVATAYEKEDISGLFTISRSGATTYPLKLHLSFSGNSDITKGSATPADYSLKTADDVTVNDTVIIPAGSSSIVLHCKPVQDTSVEVPEMLTCSVNGTSATASLQICDAQNTSANNRLFVAQLSPEAGAITSGSGLSTILVRGDNTIGTLNLNFYGLSTPQTAVHVHIKNPISGPHVESLPMGQVLEHDWNIRAAHFLTTDQATLDALFAGKLYVNVHSSNYPTGEIRA